MSKDEGEIEGGSFMKCSLCGREYPLYDLLCLNRGRTANRQCEEEHHLVLCPDCQKVVYETLKGIVEAEGDERRRKIEGILLEASIILDDLKYQLMGEDGIVPKDLETVESCIDEALKLLEEAEGR